MLSNSAGNTGQLPLTFQPERQVFTVSDLNASLQRVLESDFQGIFVAGEVSGCRLASSGHYYFSLKDDKSQLSCVLFKGTARYLKFRPQDGLAVIARGGLQVYQIKGEYNLVIDALEPQGAGALQLAFEQLKRKLASEGLFDAARKRALPRLPRRIGIVTSPSGAVIRDMLQVLARRFPGLHVRLFPAQVQGENAVEQVSQGVAEFSRGGWAEVVIVARGGGSLEDLWTFNEEAVARAVAASRVPVISAIGHETDFTICDFVADLRAPTPSAAAELVVCTRESLLEQISAARAKLSQGVRYRLLRSSRDLHQKGADRAAALVHRAVAKRAQRVDDLEFTLRRWQRRLLEDHRRRLAELRRRLQAADLRLRFARDRRSEELLRGRLVKCALTRIWNARRRWEALHLHLQQISPLTVLSRGYAIVQNAAGRALKSSEQAAPGDQLTVRLHQGELTVTVDGDR